MSRSLLWAPESFAAAFQCLVHKLFVHDQESTEAMKIIWVPFATEVVSKIRDVRPLADIKEGCHCVLASHRDLRHHASATSSGGPHQWFTYIAAINCHRCDIRVHAGARRF